MKTLSGGAAVSGAAMGMLFELEGMSWQQFTAFAIVGLVCLMFGTLGRLSAFDPKEDDFKFKTERRRSIMLFGTLYILSLYAAERLEVTIIGMALIAGAFGLAGPLIVKPLIDMVVNLIGVIFPGSKK